MERQQQLVHQVQLHQQNTKQQAPRPLQPPGPCSPHDLRAVRGTPSDTGTPLSDIPSDSVVDWVVVGNTLPSPTSSDSGDEFNAGFDRDAGVDIGSYEEGCWGAPGRPSTSTRAGVERYNSKALSSGEQQQQQQQLACIEQMKPLEGLHQNHKPQQQEQQQQQEQHGRQTRRDRHHHHQQQQQQEQLKGVIWVQAAKRTGVSKPKHPLQGLHHQQQRWGVVTGVGEVDVEHFGPAAATTAAAVVPLPFLAARAGAATATRARLGATAAAAAAAKARAEKAAPTAAAARARLGRLRAKGEAAAASAVPAPLAARAAEAKRRQVAGKLSAARAVPAPLPATATAAKRRPVSGKLAAAAAGQSPKGCEDEGEPQGTDDTDTSATNSDSGESSDCSEEEEWDMTGEESAFDSSEECSLVDSEDEEDMGFYEMDEDQGGFMPGGRVDGDLPEVKQVWGVVGEPWVGSGVIKTGGTRGRGNAWRGKVASG